MRITINGKRIELSAKQMISPDDWNENKGIAKTKKEEGRTLNKYLGSYAVPMLLVIEK